MDDPSGSPSPAGYVRFLLVVSAVLLASALFHTAVFLTGETAWKGFISWRKPIVFALSFGVTILTMALVLHLLPRADRLGWILALIFGLSGLAEVTLITLQQWRGVPSHFNAARPFDFKVVVALGSFFVPIIISLLGIGIWSWRSLPSDSGLSLAIKSGMVFLILGQLAGVIILMEGLQILRENAGNIEALYPKIHVYRIPHAVSLHAIQVLIVIGALADRWLENRNAGKWIIRITSLVLLIVAVYPLTGRPG